MIWQSLPHCLPLKQFIVVWTAVEFLLMSISSTLNGANNLMISLETDIKKIFDDDDDDDNKVFYGFTAKDISLYTP